MLLVDMPRMLREIFEEAISADGSMQVVGEVRSAERLLDEARRTRPEFVVCGDGRDRLLTELLYEHPRTTVLALERAGERSALWELRPHRTPLGEATPARILAAIRDRRVTSAREAGA